MVQWNPTIKDTSLVPSVSVIGGGGFHCSCYIMLFLLHMYRCCSIPNRWRIPADPSILPARLLLPAAGVHCDCCDSCPGGCSRGFHLCRGRAETDQGTGADQAAESGECRGGQSASAGQTGSGCRTGNNIGGGGCFGPLIA